MRTFVEIVRELKKKLGLFWSIEKMNRDFAVLAKCSLDVIVVHVNGRLEIMYIDAIHTSLDLHPDHLAAISEACSEIAANYKAEQEEQQ